MKRLKKTQTTTQQNVEAYNSYRNEQYRIYDDYAKKFGLRIRSLSVITLLYYSQKGLTQAEITRRSFNTKQAVNKIIKKLLAAKQVTEQPLLHNRKSKLIVMTDKGREDFRALVTFMVAASNKAMSKFSANEQKEFLKLSQRYTANLSKFAEGEAKK